jgi:hypothetical protein
VTCPRCGQSAAFHSHRARAPTRLVGRVRYARAYYRCRRRGHGVFPFDRQAGRTARSLTPGLERVAALAGAALRHIDPRPGGCRKRKRPAVGDRGPA